MVSEMLLLLFLLSASDTLSRHARTQSTITGNVVRFLGMHFGFIIFFFLFYQEFYGNATTLNKDFPLLLYPLVLPANEFGPVSFSDKAITWDGTDASKHPKPHNAMREML